MNDHLAKPIRTELLERMLGKWLPRPDEARSSGETALPPLAGEQELRAFDRDGLMTRLAGDSQLVQRVVSRFLGDMSGQLAALAEAVGNPDPNPVRLIAHSIKGAAASAGGVRLSETARNMELLAKAGDLEGTRRLMPELTAGLERFRGEAEGFGEP
jgi:HPt (histidine-containing phosphotransfer) domain-containing protein